MRMIAERASVNVAFSYRYFLSRKAGHCRMLPAPVAAA
jgi:hypothetical protein